MALLFVDGFDHFDPQALKPDGVPNYGYAKAQYAPQCERVPGRRSASSALRFPANTQGVAMVREIGYGVSRVIVGCALRLSLLPPNRFPLLFVRTASSQRYELSVNSIGLLGLGQGGWPTGESLRAISAQTWNHLELKVVEGNGTGLLELRVNSQTWLTISGQSIPTGGNLVAGGVCWADQPWPVELLFDDFYLADGSGTRNNDYLGDVRIDALHPTGAGTFSQWTPSGAGQNWEMVDEPLPDHSDYVTATNTGDRDSYAFQPLPAMNTPTVLGVQVTALAKKTDAGAGTLKALTQSGATVATGTAQALTTDPTYLTTVFEQTATGVDWTEAELNAAEFGVEKG